MKLDLVTDETYDQDTGCWELSLSCRISLDLDPDTRTENEACVNFNSLMLWVDTLPDFWLEKNNEVLCARQSNNGIVARVDVGHAKYLIRHAVVDGMTPVIPGRSVHADSDWKYSLATKTWQLTVRLATVLIGRVEVKTKK